MNESRNFAFFKNFAVGLVAACLVVAVDKIFSKICCERNERGTQNLMPSLFDDADSADRPKTCRPDERRSSHTKRAFDFYGVKFGRPSKASTNDLVRLKATFNVNDCNDDRPYFQYVWSERDETPCISNIFEFAEIYYSYVTVTPESVRFYVAFPKGTTRSECIELLNGFEAEMRAKYGIALKDVQNTPNAEEPVDFVFGDPPEDVLGSSMRYACASGSEFYHREFSKGELYGNLVAGETRYGERCAILYVFDMSMRDRMSEGIVK